VSLRITLDLSSLAQVDAIQSALEMFADTEEGRKEGDPKEWTAADEATLVGAREALALLSPPAQPRRARRAS